jgi:type I restriction enzyme S subunit
MSEDTISIGREGNGSEINLEDIPDDWELPEVGDVSEVNSNPKSDETDVPYLPMDALDTEMPSPKYTERRNPKENSGTMFKQYDTLFAKITPSTENGKSAYIDEIDTSVGIATTEVITLSPEETHPLYLYYYANSHPSKEYAVSRMRGTSGRQRVPKSVFERELKIPLPNLQEQRRIASILYSVDEQLRTLNDRHDMLSRQKHGLMQDLLTGTKRFGTDSTDTEDWMEEPSKILDETTVGRIPEYWETARLANLSKDSLYGLNESAQDQKEGEDMIPFIRVTNLRESVCGLNKDMKYVRREKVGDKELKKNDILFARSGSVGKTYLLEEDEDASYGGYMIRYRINDKRINPRYLLQFTKSPMYWDWIERVSRGGVQQNISTKEYDDLMVPIPPEEEQQRIASILYTVDEMIERTSELIDEYEHAKRGLMQDLLCGDVRTPEDLEVLEAVQQS